MSTNEGLAKPNRIMVPPGDHAYQHLHSSYERLHLSIENPAYDHTPSAADQGYRHTPSEADPVYNKSPSETDPVYSKSSPEADPVYNKSPSETDSVYRHPPSEATSAGTYLEPVDYLQLEDDHGLPRARTVVSARPLDPDSHRHLPLPSIRDTQEKTTDGQRSNNARSGPNAANNRTNGSNVINNKTTGPNGTNNGSMNPGASSSVPLPTSTQRARQEKSKHKKGAFEQHRGLKIFAIVLAVLIIIAVVVVVAVLFSGDDTSQQNSAPPRRPQMNNDGGGQNDGDRNNG